MAWQGKHPICSDMVWHQGGFQNATSYDLPKEVDRRRSYGFLDITGQSNIFITFRFKSLAGKTKDLLRLYLVKNFNIKVNHYSILSNATKVELPSQEILGGANNLVRLWVALNGGNIEFGRGLQVSHNTILTVTESNIEPGDYLSGVVVATISNQDFAFLLYSRDALTNLLTSSQVVPANNIDCSNAFDRNFNTKISTPLEKVVTTLSLDVSGSCDQRYIHLYTGHNKCKSLGKYVDIFHSDNSTAAGSLPGCQLMLSTRYLPGKERCTFMCMCPLMDCKFIILEFLLGFAIEIFEIEVY